MFVRKGCYLFLNFDILRVKTVIFVRDFQDSLNLYLPVSASFQDLPHLEMSGTISMSLSVVERQLFQLYEAIL